MSNVITGTGSYVPDVVVTNEDIAAMHTDFDPVRASSTLEEWCRTHTGAVTRRHVSPGEGTSDMATVAAQRALDDAGLRASDIDLIVLSTASGDYRLPQTAALVQANLGVHGKFLQLEAGCSGFVDALMTTDGLMDTQDFRHALVIGCDTLSFFLNPAAFIPMVMFGDGAGAVVLSHQPESRYGLRSYSAGSDGEMGFNVFVPGGGTKKPLTPEALTERQQYVSMKFSPIGPYAVDRMVYSTREAVQRAGIALSDVRWIVPHQASTNIIKEVARQLELPEEMFVIVFDHTGNTSSSAVAIAMDEANRAGKFADGDWMVLPAVGAGMAWGAAALVWHDYRAARKGKNGKNGTNGHNGHNGRGGA